MRRLRNVATVVVAGLVLAACNPLSSGDEADKMYSFTSTPDAGSELLFSETLDRTAQPAHAAVVLVAPASDQPPGKECSGTVIHGGYILTAGHCAWLKGKPLQYFEAHVGIARPDAGSPADYEVVTCTGTQARTRYNPETDPDTNDARDDYAVLVPSACFNSRNGESINLKELLGHNGFTRIQDARAGLPAYIDGYPGNQQTIEPQHMAQSGYKMWRLTIPALKVAPGRSAYDYIRVDGMSAAEGSSGSGVVQQCADGKGDCIVGVLFGSNGRSVACPQRCIEYHAWDKRMVDDVATWTGPSQPENAPANPDEPHAPTPDGYEVMAGAIHHTNLEPAHNVALQMWERGGEPSGYCSGSLLGDGAILTAGDCLVPARGPAPTRYVAYVGAARPTIGSKWDGYLAKCTGSVDPSLTRYRPTDGDLRNDYGVLRIGTCEDDKKAPLDLAGLAQVAGSTHLASPKPGDPVIAWGYPASEQYLHPVEEPLLRMWYAQPGAVPQLAQGDMKVVTGVRWPASGSSGGGVTQICPEQSFDSCTVGVIVAHGANDMLTYRPVDTQMWGDVLAWIYGAGAGQD